MVVVVTKGRGGYMLASICIKTKYITQKHDNKPVCAGLWAWTAGGSADEWFIVQVGKSAIFFGGRGGGITFPFLTWLS